MKTFLTKLFDLIIGRRIDDRINNRLLFLHSIYGDPSRLKIGNKCVLNNALFNVVSGNVIIENEVFFGHNVCILTGTHDVSQLGVKRQEAVPSTGRDIRIESGVWVASNATVIGPCVVGADSVVAAGAVVVRDVAPLTIVAGVPARQVGVIETGEKSGVN
jgi:acetyltransferase-like isoleucine patch superfamily enzyme